MSYWISGATLVSGIGGAALSAGAAGDAAAAQEQASQEAAQRIDSAQKQATIDMAPYTAGGVAANNRLLLLLGLNNPTAPGGSQHRITEQDLSGNGMSTLDPFYAAYGGFDAARQPGSSFQALPADQQAAINLAATNAWNAANPNQDSLDPAYGSLTKPFSVADLNADPVYQSGLQFGADQGTKAINARATATGNFDSGATLKALTQFGNDYGSTKANDSFNRNLATKSSIYGMLSGTSNAGQQAQQSVNNIGTNAANSEADLATQAGNARAAGIVGGANAWGSLGSTVSGAYNTANTSNILSKLLAPQTGGSGAGTYLGNGLYSNQ